MLKYFRGANSGSSSKPPPADATAKPEDQRANDAVAEVEQSVDSTTVTEKGEIANGQIANGAAGPVELLPPADTEVPLSARKDVASPEKVGVAPKSDTTGVLAFPTTEEPLSGATSPTDDTAAKGAAASPAERPMGAILRIRRVSFRSFGFFYGRSTTNVATDTELDEEASTEVPTSDAPTESTPKSPSIPLSTPTGEKLKKAFKPSKADKRASSYALLLRSIIIGTAPPSDTSNPTSSRLPLSSKSKSKSKNSNPASLKKLKSELLKPKEANRLIAEVRNLPTPDTSKGVLHGTLRGLNGKLVEQDFAVVPSGRTPIHAVCLDCTDEEADHLHFNQLTSSSKPRTTVLSLTPEIAQTGPPSGLALSIPTPNIAQADLASVIPVLRSLKLVDLVAQSVDVFTDTVGSPSDDFGFGRPPGEGVLSGAVPSSSTMAQGLMQVGQELLNLGFATSQAIVPNHSGVYPPKDRLSTLTYWWGYEVVIPPPSMKYLANCKSIQNALLNFLTAFSLFNNGVREILPFIRYASQFIDFEWAAVKAQDKGKGVVCAATWVMPAALVPRAWDFTDPPANAKKLTASTSLQAILDARTASTPGTEVIVSPIQPTDLRINAYPVPMVTLSPPTLADAVVATDGP